MTTSPVRTYRLWSLVAFTLVAPALTAACDDRGELGASDTRDPSDTASTPDGSGTTPDPDVVVDTATPEVEPVAHPTFSTSIGDWTMQPGDETTRCVHRRLTNEEPIWVTSIHTKLAPGSHHLIVYRSTHTEEDDEPKPCVPFIDVVGGDAYPLMITQIGEETLTLPPGVALKLEPHQMIRLEAHYLDYLPGPIVAHADVEFRTIPEAEVENEAGLMLYGTPDIDIAPRAEATTPWFYLPVWEGKNIFAATGHTHRFGTNVELRKAGAAAPTGLADEPVTGATDIYPGDEGYAWDEAPVVFYDPPLHIGANEGIQYRCSWHNTSNQWVQFGESAEQEMCFFWLYYYPTDGYRLCINLGSWYDYAEGIVEHVECCPDSRVCPAIKSFLESDYFTGNRP